MVFCDRFALERLRKQVTFQQYKALKKDCELLLAKHPDTQSVMVLLALSCAQLGEVLRARNIMASIDLSELDHEARLDACGVYILLFELEKAVAWLQALKQQTQRQDILYARLGLAYMGLGEERRAIDFFKQSLNIQPHQLSVLINLASLYYARQDFRQMQMIITKGMDALTQQEQDFPDAVLSSFQRRLQVLQLQCWVQLDSFAQIEQWLEQKKAQEDEDGAVFWISTYAEALAEKDNHDMAEEVLREALKHYPRNIILISAFSELAQLQGRAHQAVHMLELALKESPDNPSLWSKMALVCLPFAEKKAEVAAERAWALVQEAVDNCTYSPQQIKTLKQRARQAMAEVKAQTQQPEQAEKLYLQLLDESPNFVPALNGLGQLYMQQGKFEAAIKYFERLKIINPLMGYSALINAKKFPEDIETLEKMDKAARVPSLEGRVRTGVLFQLATAWEKRKDYDKAFAYAREANELSKRFLSYDPKQHRQYCARIRYAFSASLFEHRQDCGYRGEDASLPVFVVGMPRSGTTLVEQILASHSDIFGAGELGIIPARIQALNRWERHVGTGREYPDCVDDLTPETVEKIAREIIDELRQYHQDARYIVDKLPHNFENIGLIKFIFPQAKIISVRRDPCDIAISNYFTSYQARHGGMGFAYDLQWLGEQLADHNLLMHYWHDLFAGEILEIHYEEIVENTEAAVRKMLDYLGVEWQPQVLDFNKLKREVKTASLWQVRQPIYKSSRNKWRRYEKYLAPLIRGTNAKIRWDPIEMIALPEPGLQTKAADLFNAGDLDGAELHTKKMLYHNPDHAAANYLLGLVYCRKGYVNDGIDYLIKALLRCPWQHEWRDALLDAYKVSGQSQQAKLLENDFEKWRCQFQHTTK